MKREIKRKRYLIQLEYKQAIFITLIRTKEKKENRIWSNPEKILHLILEQSKKISSYKNKNKCLKMNKKDRKLLSS